MSQAWRPVGDSEVGCCAFFSPPQLWRSVVDGCLELDGAANRGR